MADIARLVIRSDNNNDMAINLKELKALSLRIRLSLQEKGIDLDEESFQSMVRLDPDISTVLKVVGAIMFEEESIDGKNLDEYADLARREVERQNELTGSLFAAGSALARLRKIATTYASAESRGEEVEATIFTLQERYTQGSVDVARGTRVTLSRNSQSSRAFNIMRNTLTENASTRRALDDQQQSNNMPSPLAREREVRDLAINNMPSPLARERELRDLAYRSTITGD